MMTGTVLDPYGALLVELRDDATFGTLISGRISFEPAPPVYHPTTHKVITEGWAREKGKWVAFATLVTLDAPPDPYVPVTFATYGVTLYGITPQNAWALYGALVKAVHEVGPRLKVSGLGIYKTIVVGGGEQGKDPDTQQPTVTATISLIATAQAVTA